VQELDYTSGVIPFSQISHTFDSSAASPPCHGGLVAFTAFTTNLLSFIFQIFQWNKRETSREVNREVNREVIGEQLIWKQLSLKKFISGIH
jgi:hypothetical protein